MVGGRPAPAAMTGLKTERLRKLRGHLSAHRQRLGKPSKGIRDSSRRLLTGTHSGAAVVENSMEGCQKSAKHRSTM